MTADLTERIASWSGRGVVTAHHAPTGAWVFICLHDDRLGPCTGGSRMKVYPSLDDALEDGMRLASAMTRKWAAIDQPFGGGKAVLALARPVEGPERHDLLRTYGRLIAALRGAFQTGEDLGTSTEDLRVVAGETDHVQGFDPGTGEKVDPSPYTARGVFRGIEAGLAQRFGSSEARGRSALIQGVGNVGLHLGRWLRKAGARLLVSDLDAERCRAVAGELDAVVVEPEAVYSTPCDIYAPCAVGATVSPQTIPRLACSIVAGSANNQLASDADAEVLHQRGILYLPDYVLNAGGALSFALMRQGVPAGDDLARRIDQIGEILSAILAEAAERDESPLTAAQRRVDRTLAAA
ncbi:MAG: Glu/Leu/Phe/Val dehydrogenase dimerization domain-containing protein [Thermoanaerobaculia bacterium]|nr:Glu/Leu/Phe/Val dehydrogenase dimerization domain-containing protein [Thermoanaerobaculia bacterium]